jgi:precorrin-3B methylase
LTTLGDADLSSIDMSTLVLIGSSETRLIPCAHRRAWMFTPRGYGTPR